MSSELGGSTASIRASINARVGEAVQQYQAAVDDLDRESARLLGVNSTDLRCLEVLLLETAEATPTMLATQLGLTTGSVTAMLDRLETLGYVTRSPHPTDGRKTIVRLTELILQRVDELKTPLLDEGNRILLARYTAEQLELIIDFLHQDAELQRRHTQRLRAIRQPWQTPGRSGVDTPPGKASGR